MGHFEMLCLRCGFLSRQLQNEDAAWAFFRLAYPRAVEIPAPPDVHYFTNLQFNSADAIDLMLFAVVRAWKMDQKLYDVICMIADLHEAMDRNGEGGKLETLLSQNGFFFSRDHNEGFARSKKFMHSKKTAIEAVVRTAVKIGLEDKTSPRSVEQCLRIYRRFTDDSTATARASIVHPDVLQQRVSSSASHFPLHVSASSNVASPVPRDQTFAVPSVQEQ